MGEIVAKQVLEKQKEMSALYLRQVSENHENTIKQE